MPAVILSGKEIIKKVEDEPAKEVMNGWNWKRIHDEIMLDYSEVNENQKYRLASGKWIIEKRKQSKNAKQKLHKKKPAGISKKTIARSGEEVLLIPWRYIKSIEVNLMNDRKLHYNIFENGGHKALSLKFSKQPSLGSRPSKVGLNLNPGQIKRDYLRFKSLRSTARVYGISHETVRRILSSEDKKQ